MRRPAAVTASVLHIGKSVRTLSRKLAEVLVQIRVVRPRLRQAEVPHFFVVSGFGAPGQMTKVREDETKV